MTTTKYETIKRKAIEELRTGIETAGGWPADKSFMALLPAIEMRVGVKYRITERGSVRRIAC